MVASCWCVQYNVKRCKEYGIATSAFYEEPGNEYFGKCAYSQYEEWDDIFDYPSNKEELDALRQEIGMGSDLDEFMSVTWEQLEEEWCLEDEDHDEESDGDVIEDIEDDEDDECEDVVEDVTEDIIGDTTTETQPTG